jgi:hypothetical protein
MSSKATKAMNMMTTGLQKLTSKICLSRNGRQLSVQNTPSRRSLTRVPSSPSSRRVPSTTTPKRTLTAVPNSPSSTRAKRKPQPTPADPEPDTLAQPSSRKRLRLSSQRFKSAATPQLSCRASPLVAEEMAASCGSFPLAALSAGPYLSIVSFLDRQTLARTDVACRLLRGLNELPTGPWQSLGERAFNCMELDVSAGFQTFDRLKVTRSGIDSFKARCEQFTKLIPTFSSPFTGSEIKFVENPDEVAYCRCRLRTDLLALQREGMYVEVEVYENADNLSLAVVDFEGGGRSSVTFSPETGAVLRERKVREHPRAIEGTYIHLLPAAAQGRKFEGTMGIYLRHGHLSFFRRWAISGPGNAEKSIKSRKVASWESTGFCTDLKWAQGSRLSICLAFRDSGTYNVRLTEVGFTPPFEPKASKDAYEDSKWSLLYGDDDHPLAI